MQPKAKAPEPKQPEAPAPAAVRALLACLVCCTLLYSGAAPCQQHSEAGFCLARRLQHLQPPLALSLRLQPGKHVMQLPVFCNSICWYYLLTRHVYHRPAPAPAAASTTAPAAAAAPAAASAEPAAAPAPAAAAAAAPAASGDPYASAASNLATGDSLKQSIDGVRQQPKSSYFE